MLTFSPTRDLELAIEVWKFPLRSGARCWEEKEGRKEGMKEGRKEGRKTFDKKWPQISKESSKSFKLTHRPTVQFLGC